MDNIEVLRAIVTEPSGPISVQPPLKKVKIKADTPRAAWDTEKIIALLKLRYSEEAKKKYNSTKTNKQKKAFWLWLSTRFNTKVQLWRIVLLVFYSKLQVTGVKFDPDQVKRRVQSLLTEWRSLQNAELETGNPTGDKIRYPEYYETMVECIQVIRIVPKTFLI